MKILLAYITVTASGKFHPYAERFCSTYRECKPGVEHSTVVICNGGEPSWDRGRLFTGTFPDDDLFFIRNNDPGWDLSAFMEVSATFRCDMLVCLGESVYFHRAGWLRRMLEAWQLFGPGMYGFWASNHVRPHINTTGFVCDPRLLRGQSWPRSKDERYEFEHGKTAFWRYVQSLGKPTKLVTWDGFWDPPMWRLPHNCFWRGTQENCLAFCSHTDRFRDATNIKKAEWSHNADAAFK